MTITDITDQKKNRGRMNLFIDGSFYCSVPARLVEDRTVSIGMMIDKDGLDRIVFESDRRIAFEYACNYLGKFPSTIKCLKDRLYDKGYGRAVVEYVIDQLISYKYLDDEEYARAYYYAVCNKFGLKRIAAELAKKGVCDNDINVIYTLAAEENTQLSSALAATQKHCANAVIDEKYMARLYRFLCSRGYDGDTVRKCLDYVRSKKDEGSQF